jgi:hypothetical protein
MLFVFEAVVLTTRSAHSLANRVLAGRDGAGRSCHSDSPLARSSSRTRPVVPRHSWRSEIIESGRPTRRTMLLTVRALRRVWGRLEALQQMRRNMVGKMTVAQRARSQVRAGRFLAGELGPVQVRVQSPGLTC